MIATIENCQTALSPHWPLWQLQSGFSSLQKTYEQQTRPCFEDGLHQPASLNNLTEQKQPPADFDQKKWKNAATVGKNNTQMGLPNDLSATPFISYGIQLSQLDLMGNLNLFIWEKMLHVWQCGMCNFHQGSFFRGHLLWLLGLGYTGRSCTAEPIAATLNNTGDSTRQAAAHFRVALYNSNIGSITNWCRWWLLIW